MQLFKIFKATNFINCKYIVLAHQLYKCLCIEMLKID